MDGEERTVHVWLVHLVPSAFHNPPRKEVEAKIVI